MRLCECHDLLHHSPADKRTSIASSDKNPGRLIRCHRIAIRHRKIDILSEVFIIVDSLLDGVVLQTFDTQVGIWVAESIESVLQNDHAAVLLLCCLSSG